MRKIQIPVIIAFIVLSLCIGDSLPIVSDMAIRSDQSFEKDPKEGTSIKDFQSNKEPYKIKNIERDDRDRMDDDFLFSGGGMIHTIPASVGRNTDVMVGNPSSDNLQKPRKSVHDRVMQMMAEETEKIVLENARLERKTDIFLFFSFCLTVGMLIFIFYNIWSIKKLDRKILENKERSIIRTYKMMRSYKRESKKMRFREQILGEISATRRWHDIGLVRILGTPFFLNILNVEQEEKIIKNRGSYIYEFKNQEENNKDFCGDLLVEEEFHCETSHFVHLVQELIKQQRKYMTVRDYIDPKIVWECIENEVKVALYHIIEEAFERINKNTYITQLDFKIFQQNKDSICFIVESNRILIRFNAFQELSYRAKKMGGKLMISSTKGQDTKMKLILDIRSPKLEKLN